MLQVHEEGKAVVASGDKGEGRVRCRPPARARSLGDAQAGLMMSRRIERDRKGGYRLRLPAEERDFSASPGQLASSSQTDDPSLRRLSRLPTTTTRGRRRVRRARCGRAARREARGTRVVEETAVPTTSRQRSSRRGSALSRASASCSGPSSTSARRPTNRSSIPTTRRAPALALYGYLSWLQEQAVEALAAPAVGATPSPVGRARLRPTAARRARARRGARGSPARRRRSRRGRTPRRAAAPARAARRRRARAGSAAPRQDPPSRTSSR